MNLSKMKISNTCLTWLVFFLSLDYVIHHHVMNIFFLLLIFIRIFWKENLNKALWVYENFFFFPAAWLYVHILFSLSQFLKIIFHEKKLFYYDLKDASGKYSLVRVYFGSMDSSFSNHFSELFRLFFVMSMMFEICFSPRQNIPLQ